MNKTGLLGIILLLVACNSRQQNENTEIILENHQSKSENNLSNDHLTYQDIQNEDDVNFNNTKKLSLEDLELQFIDRRIEMVEKVYGDYDSYGVLNVGRGREGLVLSYYIYYNSIQLNGTENPIVFFTLSDKRGHHDIVDKIKIGNFGKTVYWNAYNSVKLRNR